MPAAIFVPSYCLALEDGEVFLSSMSIRSLDIVSVIFTGKEKEYVILSTSYSTWQIEARFKKEYLAGLGVPETHIRIIPEITNTLTESAGLKKEVALLKVRKLRVIADKWHLPRVLQALRWYIPEVEVKGIPFITLKYDTTYEPSKIKRLRSRKAVLWIAWNLIFRIADALLLRFDFLKERFSR